MQIWPRNTETERSSVNHIVDMIKAWCDINCCMRWSWFVTKLLATRRSHMVVALLYAMQSPCNCFTLSVCDSNSCKSNSWREDHVTTHWYRSRWWRSWCHAGDDGDHNGTLEMEMKGTRWSWPYHVTYYDCMWCLSFMNLIFLSSAVAL